MSEVTQRSYVFEQLKPFVDNDHYVHVFDRTLKATDRTPFFDQTVTGRVRIVAILPRKPLPLENIPFAVAACSPTDLKHFRKDKANLIAVGRLAKFLQTGQEKNNVGRIDKLNSMDEFFETAIIMMGVVPWWIDPINFNLDSELAGYLVNRLETLDPARYREAQSYVY